MITGLGVWWNQYSLPIHPHPTRLPQILKPFSSIHVNSTTYRLEAIHSFILPQTMSGKRPSTYWYSGFFFFFLLSYFFSTTFHVNNLPFPLLLNLSPLSPPPPKPLPASPLFFSLSPFHSLRTVPFPSPFLCSPLSHSLSFSLCRETQTQFPGESFKETNPISTRKTVVKFPASI